MILFFEDFSTDLISSWKIFPKRFIFKISPGIISWNDSSKLFTSKKKVSTAKKASKKKNDSIKKTASKKKQIKKKFTEENDDEAAKFLKDFASK